MLQLFRNTSRKAIALATAGLLIANTLLAGAAATAASGDFITSAQASPSTVAPGSSTTITTTVQAPESTTVLVDMEIFDSAYKKVYQAFTDHIPVTAGTPKNVPFVWNAPADLPEGSYIISMGVFGESWSTMHKWHAGAATFTVKKGEGTPSVTAVATTSPDKIKIGSSIHVEASVTSSVYTDALVELTVLRPDGTQAAVFPFNTSLPAGQAKSVSFDWKAPAGAPLGLYQVKLAAYKPDRSQTFGTKQGIASFTVYSDTVPPLPVPEGITAVPGETSVALKWSPVSGATAYEVEADGAVTHVTSASFTHSGLLADTAHTYRVRAKNDLTASAWSTALPVRTLKPAAAGIKVITKNGTSASTQMITPELEIVNTGTSAVKLSDLKARYYFTIDGEKPFTIGFWTTTAKETVKTEFVKMPIPSVLADYYLEISFPNSTAELKPGSKVGVYTWINKNDWSSFEQTGDYSFVNNGSAADNPKATGYLAGSLAWGKEPVLLNLPPFPGHLTAVPADTSMALTWDAVPGVTSYELSADGEIITGLKTPSHTVNYLRPGTLHTYKIRSVQNGTASVWSAPVTLKTTGQQQLPAPSNVRAKVADGTVTLTWQALTETITGYDVEADGTVIAAGTGTSYTQSGLEAGSNHTYRVRAKDGTTLGPWSSAVKVNLPRVPTGPFDVTFTIDTSAERAPISPYIYGTNDDLSGTENWKSRRMGGNRLSTYNWENNASNAGEDYFEQSDDYIARYYGGIPWGGPTNEPGIGAAGFHQKSLQYGAYTLTTVPIAGYVAKDKNGTVTESETAPSNRWVPVKAFKGGPLSLTPDLNDNAVYIDEFVNNMVHRFGPASGSTGVKGYALDNEPALWSTTHPLMHPGKTGAAEVLNKGIDAAKAIKSVDPTAEVYGPVAYSFDEMYNMHAANDWEQVKGNYGWYVDYYLDKFRVASEQNGKRLLDAFDIHWYPEISAGGYRITDSQSNSSLAANKARMQAPRSLWDPSYTEDSWIGTWFSSYLPVIPRLQQSIDTYNPDTKIAFTEYNYGGENNVYGGIANADVLGIFGKFGVHLATFWKMFNTVKDATYITAAFNLFTNYDGHKSGFGDIKVKAETSDIENSSIYGSVFQDNEGKLHLIVLNKNNDFEINGTFKLAGGKTYKTAKVYAFDENSPVITERQGVASIENGTFTYKLPKLTAAHIVLSE
ncbi:glycoside hydrolase family 44 protein [Gorillibacterium sp. sgz5001074]|uniref:glycoside hydrolase family 44 protein n=1 Tax=Gorillibacterium sp. sgz5001074 TaxID=3446695 RepID=UPI003F67A1FE